VLGVLAVYRARLAASSARATTSDDDRSSRRRTARQAVEEATSGAIRGPATRRVRVLEALGGLQPSVARRRFEPMGRLFVWLSPVAAAALLFAAGAGSVPHQSPAEWYWTPSFCEHQTVSHLIQTTSHHNFRPAESICIGNGGQRTCKWSTGSHSRLYSEFTAYTRSPIGGVVRSFTLDTHGGHGVPAWGKKSSDPPPFYVSRVKLIATAASPTQFRTMVKPLAAKLRKQQTAKGCGA
jgi:hypothetical protein